MAFCRKMYDTVDIIFLKYLCYCFFIADICFYKCIVFSVFNILQVFKIACICQCIDINNADIIIIFFKHVMNVVGTDKSGTTCYQISSHIPSSKMFFCISVSIWILNILSHKNPYCLLFYHKMYLLCIPINLMTGILNVHQNPGHFNSFL